MTWKHWLQQLKDAVLALQESVGTCLGMPTNAKMVIWSPTLTAAVTKYSILNILNIKVLRESTIIGHTDGTMIACIALGQLS